MANGNKQLTLPLPVCCWLYNALFSNQGEISLKSLRLCVPQLPCVWKLMKRNPRQFTRCVFPFYGAHIVAS